MDTCHESFQRLFSEEGLRWTRWYDEGDPDSDKVLTRKRKSLQIRFFEDTRFFSNIKSVLSMFVDYCDEHANSDYSVSTVTKFIDFLEHTLNQRRDQSASTRYNWIRKVVPALQRLAEWQGYNELARGLFSTCELKTIKTELERAIQTELDGDMDYAHRARHSRKRMTAEEQSAMLQVIWGNGVHELGKIAMRASIESALPLADARRGMDLRQIRLGMFSLHVAKRIRPVQCTVVGACLFRSKGPRNKENQVGWIRAKDRRQCPVGALARWGFHPGKNDMGLGLRPINYLHP
ncbi:hypothetical protein EBZ39_06890 [bacterium]|nr:hypothetical protein [bacterium]